MYVQLYIGLKVVQYHTISDMHGVNKATVRRAIIAIYVTSS
jgi:hypothetical protein